MAPATSLSPVQRYFQALSRRLAGNQTRTRCLSTEAAPPKAQAAIPPPPRPSPTARPRNGRKPPIRVFPSLPSERNACKEPLKAFAAAQLARLDPSGARGRLFARDNRDAVAPGDVLLVRFRRGGEPLAGVVLSVRRRGVDTAVLLRNTVSRVGVEAWVKVFSPAVQGMEIVQRAAKRARRARLYYMRHEKHDRGSLEGVVKDYLRIRAALGFRTQNRAAGPAVGTAAGEK